ncbi:MAG: hypothetical protein ACTHWH_05895 [Marinobacter sp.]
MSDLQSARLNNVNAFIKVIGGQGRRFFYNSKQDRYAAMQLDERGRVWFVDDYSGERIYTHRDGRWRGFSQGGTLRMLVEVFRNHIKKGEKISARYFSCRSWMGGGHPWGYPSDSLEVLRKEGVRLGMVAEQEQGQ